MKFFIFQITQFIVDYLGRLFGTLRQQRWISVLLRPLSTLWSTYNQWRRKRFYIINITAQIISLEGYLNDTYDNVQRRIFILSAPVGSKGVFIALEQELQPTLDLPLEVEGGGVNIGILADFSINFIVNVPISLQGSEIAIIADVKQFKTAGKGFYVKYF